MTAFTSPSRTAAPRKPKSASSSRRSNQRSVAVPVVDVREVRMAVDQFIVMMPVQVWFAGRGGRVVDVLVMRVVRVEMLMPHRFVPMGVLVPFRQMQPDAQSHEHSRHAN